MIAATLRSLFVEGLHDIRDADRRLVMALPRMAREATSGGLREALERRIDLTEDHMSRLAGVYASINESPRAKTSKAMVGLLEEGDELMRLEGPPSVRDSALIAAALRLDHYGMATYGCLRLWAEILGERYAEQLLRKSYDGGVSGERALMAVAASLHEETSRSR